jgi:hypothetical protein
MYQEEKLKWQEAVVNRLDLVPNDVEYYKLLPVKPGFEFWHSLSQLPAKRLNTLRINIPEMLYVNFNAYMFYTEKKIIHIENA